MVGFGKALAARVVFTWCILAQIWDVLRMLAGMGVAVWFGCLCGFFGGCLRAVARCHCSCLTEEHHLSILRAEAKLTADFYTHIPILYLNVNFSCSTKLPLLKSLQFYPFSPSFLEGSKERGACLRPFAVFPACARPFWCSTGCTSSMLKPNSHLSERHLEMP